MKITSAEFVTSCVSPSQFPHTGLPEVAFTGRSNVGKSSILNSLLRRKGLAKTSSTPGKTRLINYFLVNESFYMVDLPGYGYARGPDSQRRDWARLMNTYLRERKELALVVALFDSRHGLMNNDIEMIDMLAEYSIPTLLVGTKEDKLRARERQKIKQKVVSKMHLSEDSLIILHSTITGKGKNEVLQVISAYVHPRK
ncbi:ribosome biogenesis GTP-binding protein YihA/YsxC [Candidatus Hydrogenedentota bacterium]